MKNAETFLLIIRIIHGKSFFMYINFVEEIFQLYVSIENV